MTSTTDAIQTCEWLFLRQIDEPRENSVRIVVEEAMAGAPASGAPSPWAAGEPAIEAMFKNARLIDHFPDCRVFEIRWPSYVAYSVRNECFVARDAYEVFEGRNFVRYTKSRFLDYVSLGTFARDDHPGPLARWGVLCSEHIIDVVSTEPPLLSEVPLNGRDDG